MRETVEDPGLPQEVHAMDKPTDIVRCGERNACTAKPPLTQPSAIKGSAFERNKPKPLLCVPVHTDLPTFQAGVPQ